MGPHKVEPGLVPSSAVRRTKPFGVAALATVSAVSLALFAPSSGGADSSSRLRQSAQQLRTQNVGLTRESHSALLGLYALESELASARAQVESLKADIARVERERASVRRQLTIVRKVLRVSRRNLGRRLVTIYEEGEPDPLAVVLGAQSLDAALSDLDNMTMVAGQDRSMLEQAHRSRASLSSLRRSLEARSARLDELERHAVDAAQALESARAERVAYLGRLSSQRSLNERQIGSLEARAQAAEARSARIEAQAAITPAPAPTATAPSGAPTPAPSTSTSGRTLTVVATAYALSGSTSTGLPVGPGIVAVDPSVIPLGTHMTIPGYGEGVAADTGSAIQGARIDVWVPTEAQAQQWGSQTVTIALHG
jgi:3D (Asp-Asp-Asp) domain-containing protein